RRRDPERRRGRQPAHGYPLADDRAGAEEADAGHDLRGDPRGIGANDLVTAREKLAEAVGRDNREESRAEADEQVGAQARFAVAQFALEADRTAERGGEREPSKGLAPAERRNRRTKQRRPRARCAAPR